MESEDERGKVWPGEQIGECCHGRIFGTCSVCRETMEEDDVCDEASRSMFLGAVSFVC
jgi:hypothetical protein